MCRETNETRPSSRTLSPLVVAKGAEGERQVMAATNVIYYVVHAREEERGVGVAAISSDNRASEREHAARPRD